MPGDEVDMDALDPRSLLSPHSIEDPYPLYRRLQDQAPVWIVPDSRIVVVSSFAGVTEAVSRPHDFSSNISALLYRADDGMPALLPYGGDHTNVLATADPPDHGRHRSTVFPQLMTARMSALRPEVVDLTARHLDRCVAAPSVDFMTGVANAIPIRVVSRLVGWEGESPEELFQAAIDSSSVLCATRSRDEVLAGVERTAAVGAWIAGQLQAAVDDEAPGLLGIVANAVRSGDLEFLSGLIILHTLLSAGGESTTSLLGNAVHRLAVDSELQSRLRADRALVVPFVEEILRLESPFRYHLRQVRTTTELQGVTIPGGSTVLLLWGAANRDPNEFDRADEVVLDRAGLRRHLAFGRGIHLCVGAPLARLEAEVVLTRFLERTVDVALDPTRAVVRDHSLMVRRFISLPLAVTSASSVEENP